jgi:hypothetical protein
LLYPVCLLLDGLPLLPHLLLLSLQPRLLALNILKSHFQLHLLLPVPVILQPELRTDLLKRVVFIVALRDYSRGGRDKERGVVVVEVLFTLLLESRLQAGSVVG